MKRWKVRLVIRRMGMMCKSCRQTFECEVVADNEVEAVQFAKEQSRANPHTHSFNVDLVRSI